MADGFSLDAMGTGTGSVGNSDSSGLSSLYNYGSDEQLGYYNNLLAGINVNPVETQYGTNSSEGGEGAGLGQQLDRQNSADATHQLKLDQLKTMISPKDYQNYMDLLQQSGDNAGHSLQNQALLSMATIGIGGGLYGAGAGGTSGATAAGTSTTWNPALIDSYLGTTGYGASSASALAGAAPAYSAVDAGAGGSGEEGAWSGEGDTGSSDYVRSSSDRAAQYGDTGYGQNSPSLWDKVSSGAQRGALTNGGLTAAQGGDAKDVFKSAGMGALTGGIGGGISYANPADYAGITDPQYQKYFNSGVTGLTNAGVTGSSPKDALVGSAIGSGLNYAGNGVAGYVNSGDNVPNYNMDSMPDTGTLGGTMQDQYGENSSTLGGDTTATQLASNLDNGGFNLNTQNEQQQQGNPLKDAFKSALGFVAPAGGGNVSGAGLGGMAGGLMGLYSAWQKRKQLGALQSGLQGLYTQDSPYAQQLRQTLTRSDAASGRRSQVGPREVELQARLAGLNAQMAPTLANIGMQHNQATNMGLYNLASLFGNTSGGQAVQKNAGDWGQSLYNQFLGSPMSQPNVGPQVEG